MDLALEPPADYPAFQIRGFMHDVGRNFQSLPLLRDQVETSERDLSPLFDGLPKS